MRWLVVLPLKLRSLFHRNAVNHELDEELRFHLEQRIEEGLGRGLTPEEARRAAMLAMEGLQQHKEECREARGLNAIDNTIQDLRYSLRTLRKTPIFTITAILSLALGIGANTAIFQLLDAVRLRALPVPNPSRLAEIRIANPDLRTGKFDGPWDGMTNPLFEQIRDHQQAFLGVLAWRETSMPVGSAADSASVQALFVSGDFFRVLGVPAIAGRTFSTADDSRGCGSPGAVISAGYWQRQFGGARSAIGSTITLADHSFEIVGVTPATFFGPAVGGSFDVAIPLCSEAILAGKDSSLDSRDTWWLMSMGRLKPGWSVQQASAHLAAISPGIMQAVPLTGYEPQAVRNYLSLKLAASPSGAGASFLRDYVSDPLWVLLGITGMVLLIACANLASLMLARASAREREIALRLALGASRPRLIRQLLTESLLLAIVGATAGACIARTLSHFLVSALSTEDFPLFLDLSLDWRVLGFMAAVALITCLLFGLAPAIRATRTTPGATLKSAGRSIATTREAFGFRRILVVAQVALSLVLVMAAILFARSLSNLLNVDPGFRQEGVTIAYADLSHLSLPGARVLPFRRELLEQIASVPGVDAAAEATNIPLSGASWTLGIEADHPGGVTKAWSRFNYISPSYFRTLQIPLLGGRDFDRGDTGTSPRVAVVNEMFARKFFGAANPVGRSFLTVAEPDYPATRYRIVGVARNTKYADLRQELQPIAFIPASQNPNPHRWASFLIRSGLPPSELISTVRHRMIAADPSIRTSFAGLTEQVREHLMLERLVASLTTFFGLTAALLAAIGLYGVIAYLVVRRSGEIGIRMALGASRFGVIRLMMREAAILAATGIFLGSLLALLAGRAAQSMLFGLKPSDPATLAGAAALLALIAAAASYLPARRAGRVDPMTALREE